MSGNKHSVDPLCVAAPSLQVDISFSEEPSILHVKEPVNPVVSPVFVYFIRDQIRAPSNQRGASWQHKCSSACVNIIKSEYGGKTAVLQNLDDCTWTIKHTWTGRRDKSFAETLSPFTATETHPTESRFPEFPEKSGASRHGNHADDATEGKRSSSSKVLLREKTGRCLDGGSGTSDEKDVKRNLESASADAAERTTIGLLLYDDTQISSNGL